MSALPVASKRGALLVEGEFAFRQRDFDYIANLLREESGIALQSSKSALVYSRLSKRLRLLGYRDFEDYCRLISSPEGIKERAAMVAALTTNYTSFFRESHHFDHLRATTLPELIKAARGGARVRIWSAASSTGEEPYSIALTLLEAFPEAARYDIRILATDIDPNVLATARAGLYRNETVSPVRIDLRNRWFAPEPESGGWRVRSEVKDLIAFRQINLIADWPMRGRFDVIFCRNVVIYFEEETQTTLWSRFRSALTPTGRLYVGHSERVEVPGFVSDGMTIYKLGRGRTT